MRSKTMQRRQLIGAAATAGSVTIAPALLTGCAAAPKSEPAATVATLPEGASAHVTAVAPTGAYRGCVLDGTGVRRWLGIPFIKNPYEPVRRYLKPEPYGAHEGVMDCLKHGSIPLQPNPDKNVEKKMVGGDGPLCLNIWAPKAGENLPVMVWVPGGGSISCAQNDERFDGTNFARDGVVLVTLAYRVNVDGFLKLRGGDSGNGNRDILEGLRWVKANIAAFGGDPDKITAFGQSAGGTHLVDVIASPYTKGLLAGAVIQSPSAVAQWRDAAQAEEAAKLVCDAIGCEPTREAMLKIPNESLAAFGSLAGRLAKNAAWARSTNGNIALFKAYVGDDFMPVRPVDAIAAGACEGLAVITGSTRSEWRHYIVPNGLIAKVNEATVKGSASTPGFPPICPKPTAVQAGARRRATYSPRSRATSSSACRACGSWNPCAGAARRSGPTALTGRVPSKERAAFPSEPPTRTTFRSSSTTSMRPAPSSRTVPTLRGPSPTPCIPRGLSSRRRRRLTGPNSNSAPAGPSPSRGPRPS